MLFVRHFNSILLFPYHDSAGNKYDEQMVSHLQLDATSSNKPIFLVGNIPDNIKNIVLREKNGRVSEKDSELLIKFPYDRDMIERFDERFAVDADTQVFANYINNGLIRVYYKDSLGNVDALSIDGMERPTPEVLYKLKGS